MRIEYDDRWENYMLLLCMFKVFKDGGNEFLNFCSENIAINDFDYYFEYCLHTTLIGSKSLVIIHLQCVGTSALCLHYACTASHVQARFATSARDCAACVQVWQICCNGR